MFPPPAKSRPPFSTTNMSHQLRKRGPHATPPPSHPEKILHQTNRMKSVKWRSVSPPPPASSLILYNEVSPPPKHSTPKPPYYTEVGHFFNFRWRIVDASVDQLSHERAWWLRDKQEDSFWSISAIHAVESSSSFDREWILTTLWMALKPYKIPSIF